MVPFYRTKCLRSILTANCKLLEREHSELHYDRLLVFLSCAGGATNLEKLYFSKCNTLRKAAGCILRDLCRRRDSALVGATPDAQNQH